MACRTQAGERLTVSHRALEQGSGWLMVRELEAGLLNRQLADELKSRAYTCAIPLSLNGRRLDGLQGCPSHGFAKNSYPLHLRWVEADSPILPVPPFTFQDYRPEIMPAQSEVISPKILIAPSGPRSAAYLVTVSLATGTVSRGLQLQSQSSRLYWVLDGVVVDDEDLGYSGPITCAVFASAANLSADLSGRLQHNSERKSRRAAVMSAIKQDIKLCTADLPRLIEGQQRVANAWAALIAIGGGLMLPMDGGVLGTAFMALWALYVRNRGGKSGRGLEADVRLGMQDLVASLQRSRANDS